MRSATLACAITAVLVQACAVGPDFKTPEKALPDQWHAPATQVSTADVDVQWWKQFNDLVDHALQSSPDVRIAALRVAESRVQRGAVAGARWPTMDAAASYQRNRQSENGASARPIEILLPPASSGPVIDLLSEPFGLYQAGFDAAWELDLWGRVRRSVESADAAVLASDQDLHDAQLSLIAEVTRTYLELRGVQDQIRIAEADVAASTDMADLTAYRVKGGIADSLDLSTQ
jgi:outer membrane protein TolC